MPVLSFWIESLFPWQWPWQSWEEDTGDPAERGVVCEMVRPCECSCQNVLSILVLHHSPFLSKCGLVGTWSWCFLLALTHPPWGWWCRVRLYAFNTQKKSFYRWCVGEYYYTLSCKSQNGAGRAFSSDRRRWRRGSKCFTFGGGK